MSCHVRKTGGPMGAAGSAVLLSPGSEAEALRAASGSVKQLLRLGRLPACVAC
jgi:hypothetical protein